MSDRTFRLILDGKKGQLVKGSTPASAAKKVGFYTNSVKTGKSSIIFELQETTKGHFYEKINSLIHKIQTKL